MQICVTKANKEVKRSSALPLCLKDHHVQFYLGLISLEIDKRGQESHIYSVVCVYVLSLIFFELNTNSR